MPHVYVAYDHEDTAFAAEVIGQLEGAGFAIWPEHQRRLHGEVGTVEANQAIRDAFALLLIASPAALASDLILFEWAYAQGAAVVVIAVMRGAAALPDRLKNVPQVDFTDAATPPWGRLIRSVQDAHDRIRGTVSRPVGPGGAARPSFLDRLQQRREPPPAVPDQPANLAVMIERLRHENRDLREGTARQLGELGDREAVPALMIALRDEDAHVREAVALALGKLKAASAVPALLGVIRAGRTPFNAANITVFLQALRWIGTPALPVLIDALGDDDPRMRLALVDLVAEIGGADVVPVLTGVLRDPEWRVRWQSADALGRMGDNAAVPDLLDMLTDSNRDVCISAAWALGKIGHVSAVQGLIRLLHDRDWRVRWAGAQALWEIGADAVPALLDTLRDPDEYVRRAAMRALAEIGDPAIGGLVALLGDSNWDVRWSAAAALHDVGDAAVPALVAALAAESWQAAWAAAETLKRIGTPDALRAVEQWRGGQSFEEDDSGAGDRAGIVSEIAHSVPAPADPPAED